MDNFYAKLFYNDNHPLEDLVDTGASVSIMNAVCNF